MYHKFIIYKYKKNTNLQNMVELHTSNLVLDG